MPIFASYMRDMKNIPQHIAIIMDGNGRWARLRGKERGEGHFAGMEALQKTVYNAANLGVKWLTVYAFSTENFARPKQEVDYIFKLPKEFFDLYLKELMENNVQIRFMGHLEMAPQQTRDIILSAIEKTKNNTGLILCFAFIYGSKSEMMQAVRNICEDYKNGELELEEINEKFDKLLEKEKIYKL